MGSRWPYSWCFMGCCRQDLLNIARTYFLQFPMFLAYIKITVYIKGFRNYTYQVMCMYIFSWLEYYLQCYFNRFTYLHRFIFLKIRVQNGRLRIVALFSIVLAYINFTVYIKGVVLPLTKSWASTHTHTHTHTYIYIYIYKERERQREEEGERERLRKVYTD